MVAIAIGGILMTLAYAPYSFYADKSRVAMSSERIEQLINKAKLLSTTGYTFAGTSKNADMAVYLKKGEKTTQMRALQRGTSDFNLGANTIMVEQLRLEDRVEISTLDTTPSSPEIMVIFRAPS